MGRDTIDMMIEELVGHKAEPTPPIPALEPEPDPPGTVADAALAVQKAVKAHSGRRKSVDGWKPVAAEVLGLKRLHRKRWEEVLAHGEMAGLFRVDADSLSYPVLVLLEPKPEPEPESNDTTWKVEYESEKPPPMAEAPPWDPPEDWDPPHFLDCGHMNFDTDEANEAARTEGHCCAGGARKRPRNWRYVRGEYRRPVPEHLRRTPEREAGEGYPGLPCDEEGYYVGPDTPMPED